MPLLIILLLLATQLSVAEQVVDVVENEAVEDNLVLIEINSTVHIVEKNKHTCETCWGLVGRPHDFGNAAANASPAETEKYGATTGDQEEG